MFNKNRPLDNVSAVSLPNEEMLLYLDRGSSHLKTTVNGRMRGQNARGIQQILEQVNTPAELTEEEEAVVSHKNQH